MLRFRYARWPAILMTGALVLSLIAFQPAVTQGEVSPVSLEATLAPGASVHEVKTVTLPGIIPKADVLFAFDLTGSMGSVLNTAKAKAAEIMTQLDTLIADAQYGVASFMDYPGYYAYPGYANNYGGYGDYPYRLDQPVTADRTAVVASVNSLTLGYGWDGPESYSRMLYESYADPAIAWRDGSRRIEIGRAHV